MIRVVEPDDVLPPADLEVLQVLRNSVRDPKGTIAQAVELIERLTIDRQVLIEQIAEMQADGAVE